MAARAAFAGETAGSPRLGACGPVPGAFQLPGTDACLRLSGFVAAEVGGWRADVPVAAMTLPRLPRPSGQDVSRSAIAGDARLGMDVRIPTEYGPARLYVSVRGRHGAFSSAR